MNRLQLEIEKVKSIFLSDDLLAKAAKPEIYSLPEEFAKSKKNKNFLVKFLIILYIAVIGCGAYYLTIIEANKSKRIEVNIAEFRLFNLMELLAEKKENEAKLAQLQRELEDFRKKSLEQIGKLPPRERQKAIAALNEEMKALEESYLRQIREKEQALASLEKAIAAQQREIEAVAKESEAIIRNYQSINQSQQLENQRLIIEYEEKIAALKAGHQAELEQLKQDHKKMSDDLILRYNPRFNRGEIAAAINSRLGSSQRVNFNKYNRILADESGFNEDDFNQLRKEIYYQEVIIDGLRNVGYQNSVPAALRKLSELSRSIIQKYEKIWGDLSAGIKEKNDYIESYEYALKYLAMTGRETGYVIDPRNTKRMLVFIDQIYSVKKGDIAYIFKNDAVPVAKVRLDPAGGQTFAAVVETLKPVKIEPFDKILLKLEVAQ